MSHIVEVDQSGKIEETNQNTVLAFSNDAKYSVLISSAAKQECLRVLREHGLTGQTLYTQLFTTGLYFLLRGHLNDLSCVIVDTEYEGKDTEIRQHLLNLFRRGGYSIEAGQIMFQQIGKKSPAHELAIATWRGQKGADLTLSAEDLLGEFGVVRRKRAKRKRGNK